MRCPRIQLFPVTVFGLVARPRARRWFSVRRAVRLAHCSEAGEFARLCPCCRDGHCERLHEDLRWLNENRRAAAEADLRDGLFRAHQSIYVPRAMRYGDAYKVAR
jgi:hypothetical protein